MLTFLGDVALLSYGSEKKAGNYKPNNPYIFNFEYVIDEESSFQPSEGKINLRGKEYDFCGIFGNPPLAVSITNNHINDFGESGYTHTINALLKNKINIL